MRERRIKLFLAVIDYLEIESNSENIIGGTITSIRYFIYALVYCYSSPRALKCGIVKRRGGFSELSIPVYCANAFPPQ